MRWKVPRFLKEEDGQSIVFGAITFLVLILFIFMTYNIGALASEKIRMQNAADAAAFSAAAVEANSLNAIAWINDGMAFIYYNLMRYSIDYAVFTTLAKFKRVKPPASDSLIGVPGVVQKANRATQIYREWVPRGIRWLKNLGEIERAIQAITPYLVRREAITIALANGADAVAVLPDPDFTKGGAKVVTTKDYLGVEDKIMSRLVFTEFVQKKFEKKYGKLPKLGLLSPFPGENRWWMPYFGGVSAYYQIRTCWNPKDNSHPYDPKAHPSWKHVGNPLNLFKEFRELFSALTSKPELLGVLFLGKLISRNRGAPAGHWHHLHPHLLRIPTPKGPIYIPFIHTDGHNPSSSHKIPFFWKPSIHSFPDFPIPPFKAHAVHICGTCKNMDWDTVFRISRRGAKTKGYTDVAFHVVNKVLVNVEEIPLPLPLKEKFLQNGVTVMAWQKRRSNFFDSLFSNPKYGIFTIARAKVGVIFAGKVRLDSTYLKPFTFSWSTKNLYEEVEFGPRLVPVKEGDIANLLKDFKSAPWYEGVGKVTTEPKKHLEKLGPKRDLDIWRLKDWIVH